MPKIDRQAIYERDGGLCGFCGEPVPAVRFHVDHIQPRAKGGSDELSNLRVAHRMCNISAGKQARAGRYTKWNEPMSVATIKIPTVLVARMHAMAVEQDRSLNYVASKLIQRGIEALDSTD